MVSNDFENALFKEATWRVASREAEKLMVEAEAEKFQPPPEFHAKIMALVDKNKKKKPRMSFLAFRLAASFLLGVLLTFMIFATLPSFAQWTTRLLQREVDGFTQYQLDLNGSDQSDPTNFKITHMPGGFVLTDYSYKASVGQFYTFLGEDNNYVNINIHSLTHPINVDNENLDVQKEVIINGYPANLISKYGQYNITWSQDNVIIIISSTLNERETIRVAEGIKKVSE